MSLWYRKRDCSIQERLLRLDVKSWSAPFSPHPHYCMLTVLRGGRGNDQLSVLSVYRLHQVGRFLSAWCQVQSQANNIWRLSPTSNNSCGVQKKLPRLGQCTRAEVPHSRPLSCCSSLINFLARSGRTSISSALPPAGVWGSAGCPAGKPPGGRGNWFLSRSSPSESACIVQRNGSVGSPPTQKLQNNSFSVRPFYNKASLRPQPLI